MDSKGTLRGAALIALIILIIIAVAWYLHGHRKSPTPPAQTGTKNLEQRLGMKVPAATRARAVVQPTVLAPSQSSPVLRAASGYATALSYDSRVGTLTDSCTFKQSGDNAVISCVPAMFTPPAAAVHTDLQYDLLPWAA